MNESIRIGAVYRHYKGPEYRVLALARHTETEESLVIYQALYGEGSVWARPYDLFSGRVLIDGEEVLRFTRVDRQGHFT